MKSFFPDITEVKVTLNGTPNKVFSQGMKARDLWEEEVRRFGKENSLMTLSEFDSERFALFIDLRRILEHERKQSSRFRNEIGQYEGWCSVRD